MEVEWAGSGVRGVPRRVCRDEAGPRPRRAAVRRGAAHRVNALALRGVTARQGEEVFLEVASACGGRGRRWSRSDASGCRGGFG